MTTVFLICAVIGGTVFVFQFALALIGMGADELDFGDDIPDDVDLDVADDVPHDAGLADHGSTWLFGVVSFRTVVAALTFFGLAGLTAQGAGMAPIVSAIVAIAAGYAAMIGVHWLMKKLYSLKHDGTVRIQRSVGLHGTVYVPIPKQRQGSGKIQLEMQGRIMEYAAITSGPETLPTGAKVVVIDVISPTTLEVELIREPVASR